MNDTGAVLLRGMGLGGWMLQEPYMLQLSGAATNQGSIRKKITELVGAQRTDTFYNAWLENHYTKADIDSLARWGFNSVRLPMHYNLFTLPIEEEPVKGKDTWIETGFVMTDELLSWCKVNKIYLVLDLHAAPGGEGKDAAISDYDSTKPSLWQSEENRRKTISLWSKLADRYKNETWIGGYDLVNEPNWGFQNSNDKNGCAETENAPLRSLYVDLVNAIRKVDTNHLVFIEGNCWGNNYKGMFPFRYPNIVISFHKYWNYNDSNSVRGMLEIRSQNNMPVWLGESGENSNTWTTQAIRLLEDNNIGWAWWPLKKIGFNCPFEIRRPLGYEQLVNYWRGRADKPEPGEAFKTLMQLAENLRLPKIMHHPDFTDAMFRQVYTNATKPFVHHTASTNNYVFASDFDLGKNGFAFFDHDTANYRVSTNKNVEWNRGHVYRNDAVDIKPCSDSITNGYCVSYTEDGEWLQYTIEFPVSGVYDVKVRTSGNGVLQLHTGTPALGFTLNLQSTAKIWNTGIIKNIPFKQGMNSIKVYVVKGGFDFNYLEFTRVK